jgi:putative transposase
MLPHLPSAKEMLGDKGYDSRRFREALIARGIIPCIPLTRSRKIPIPYDKVLYRQRHRIENMFGRIKDWRRVAMRYDRCAHAFFSAICLAATVLFWINES